MLLLFLAMAAYMGFYLWRSATKNHTLVTVTSAIFEETADLKGTVLREELTIRTESPLIFYVVNEYERVPAGAVIAYAAVDEAALSAMKRQKALKAELESLRAGISRAGEFSSADAGAKDSAVRVLMRELAYRLSSGDRDGADELLTAIKILLTDGALQAAQNEALRLEETLASIGDPFTGSEAIRTPAAGLFIKETDGSEWLNAATIDMRNETVLPIILGATPVPETGVIGKVISGQRWYFVSQLNEPDAEKLRASKTAVLRAAGIRSDIAVRVDIVSEPQGGVCNVLLSGIYNESDMATVRSFEAQLIFSRQRGLLVPTSAIRTDEAGNSFVYVERARSAVARQVSVLQTDGEMSLVADSPESLGLREGDVVIAGGDIYEGMQID